MLVCRTVGFGATDRGFKPREGTLSGLHRKVSGMTRCEYVWVGQCDGVLVHPELKGWTCPPSSLRLAKGRRGNGMRCAGNRAGGTVGIAPRRRSSLRKSRKGLRRGKKLVAVVIRRSLADYIGTHREKCLHWLAVAARWSWVTAVPQGCGSWASSPRSRVRCDPVTARPAKKWQARRIRFLFRPARTAPQKVAPTRRIDGVDNGESHRTRRGVPWDTRR